MDEAAERGQENSMSDKAKKLTDDPMAPMTEDLGQSADAETAEQYTASLSAEQQLVNATAPVDDDSLYHNSLPYVPGSQAMVDAIVERVVEQLKPFISEAFDEAITRALADKKEDAP